MEKKIFILGAFAFFAVFLCGCSMMPNDDEIINGSISESEIIDPELGIDNETDVDGVEDVNDLDEFDDNIDSENDEKFDDVEFEVTD